MAFFSGIQAPARGVVSAFALGVVLGLSALPATAEVDAFSRSLAESAARADDAVAAFYRGRNYQPIWTGAEHADRRSALVTALAGAAVHGLPAARHDAGRLVAQARAAVTEGDRGRLEMAMTAAFLTYAHDMEGGVLEPRKVDAGIVREVVRTAPETLLAGLVAAPDPAAFLQDLQPERPEYARLLHERLTLQAQIARGGWGEPVPAGKLGPGASGADVVALRDRLVVMGYLSASASMTYDRAMQAAVQRFQLNHGLVADGVAGPGTMDEINVAPEERLQSIVVALERLRWMGDTELGDRHVWVNQPDFTAKIVDRGRITFQTRAVIGKNVPDQRTPEFSDTMEYMVVNPSWGVPRSITTKEYLPLLQRNPNAVSHLQVIDGRGRVVPRGSVNFAAYSAKTFPFALRQPPSDGNALGKVKFMFPNQHNIYLHDTPAKNLFAHEVRAYSHGCIRLADPFDFAHVLLGAQVEDPRATFKDHLDSGRETQVSLDSTVPVHLVYFTAWPAPKADMTYRKDIYGRDAAIFRALNEAGVALDGVQG